MAQMTLVSHSLIERQIPLFFVNRPKRQLDLSGHGTKYIG